MTLVLVPLKEVGGMQPAAFHELAAARYIGTNRTGFRELMMAGRIPYTMHANGKTRIYLRADLDDYLNSLPKSTMPPRENSPLRALKGAKQ